MGKPNEKSGEAGHTCDWVGFAIRAQGEARPDACEQDYSVDVLACYARTFGLVDGGLGHDCEPYSPSGGSGAEPEGL